MKKFSDFLENRCWPGYKPKPGKQPYSPGSCMKEEDMEEEWSQKYKSSINCSHPKGFSQKAHCAGKKKHNESHEVMEMTCPDCGMCKTHGNVNESAAAAIAAATAIAKKKSGNYDSEGMRKTPYKNPDSPNRKSNAERRAELKEDLRKWFSKTDPAGGWKRINSKGEAIGPCAREPGEPKPKCMSNEKRASLSKKERASAVRAKRKNDPNPERQGKPINVSNFGKGKISEDMENLDEKNVPTSPEKWAQAKAQAKAKFDVYPSAYANGWASKKYKAMGGGWKSVSEENEVTEGAVPAQEKIITVKHKTSGKTLRISSNAAAKYRMQGYHYHPVNEAKDEQEYGYEGDMALNQLKTLVRCAEMIEEMLKPDTDLPEWVQSKITLATDYIQTAADYLYSEMKEEVMVEREDDEYHTPTRHHVQVQVSKGNGPKEHRKATVRAKEPSHAVSAAISHYKQQGYTVHDHKYLGENVEQVDEISQDLAGRYLEKVTHDQLKKSGMHHNLYGQLPPKRQAGVGRALDRLVVNKESVDSDGGPPTPAAATLTVTGQPKLNKTVGQTKMIPYVHEEKETKPPFDKPYTTTKAVVTDKSGAKHTPMSRARDLARKAIAKKLAEQENIKPNPFTIPSDNPGTKGTKDQPKSDYMKARNAGSSTKNAQARAAGANNPQMFESRQLEIVREAMKVAKKKKEVTEAGSDKFIADPELTSQITKSNP